MPDQDLARKITSRSRAFAEFLRQHQPSPLDTVKHIEGFCAELEAMAEAAEPAEPAADAEPKEGAA